MSSANKPTNPKDEANQPSSGHRKTSSPATRTAEQTPQKCPRCDSPNTKFCYYNNYSLTQPRHFCKTCRRYWTKGGALRNVPVGGGCRKNKKLKSTSKDSCSTATSLLTSSSSSSDHHLLSASGLINLKLFHGVSPAMDFQLGGLNANTTSLLTGFDYHNPSNAHNNHSLSLATTSSTTGFNNNNNNNNNNNPSTLASSIESLSSINQDLHWKLQQQRLAMLFGQGANNNSLATYAKSNNKPHHHHQAVPILFQNLEISKPDDEARRGDHDQLVAGSDQNHTVVVANNMDQWFFGINNSYNNNNGNGQVQLAHHHHHNHHGVNSNNNAAQTQSNNGNEHVTSGTTTSYNWINNVNWATSTSADLHQFSASLP